MSITIQILGMYLVNLRVNLQSQKIVCPSKHPRITILEMPVKMTPQPQPITHVETRVVLIAKVETVSAGPAGRTSSTSMC